MNNDIPLVSICIPTYNGEKFLYEALKSALNQTYSKLEIIVSDDASKDHTLQIIENFKAQSKIPFYIFHHQPKCIGANWNNCVKKANGDYIKFLFQDDVLMPNCVEQLLKIAQSNDNVGLVYCKRDIIYDLGERNDLRWFEDFNTLHKSWDSLTINEGVLPGRDYLKDKNLINPPKNKIGEPTAVLLNKACFDKVGYFNTDLNQALDIEYWYRLMPYFKIGFVNEELIKFRLHSNQATQLNRNIESRDKRLLPRLLLKNIFFYLHVNQQRQLLKELLYVADIKKFFRKAKRKLNL